MLSSHSRSHCTSGHSAPALGGSEGAACGLGCGFCEKPDLMGSQTDVPGCREADSEALRKDN